METPSDRVTYRDLRMIPSEFEDLMKLSIDAGTIEAPIPYDAYVDDSFVKAATAVTGTVTV
ncbi:MAG: hypothetical protein ABL982_23170 [Vicinamibacterales bacterium]